jgi:acyl carrier protein
VADQGDLSALVRKAAALVLDLPEVSLDANFFVLGGDSQASLRLTGLLEEALGREIPLDALFEVDDLRAYAEFLARPPHHPA